MFEDFATGDCERVEIVSTLMVGKPSHVGVAVLRAHYTSRAPEEFTVRYGAQGPMRETLDAQIRALNRFLAER